MKNKLSTILISIFVVLSILIQVVPQISANQSGTCGNNLTWSFEPDTGTLTITGTGNTDDYDFYTPSPWYDLRKKITQVIIGEGMTGIGTEAFYLCEKLKSVDIPTSVKYIGQEAFCGCDSLEEVILREGLQTIGEQAFSLSGIEEITIPATVTTIGKEAFYNCHSLKNVYFRGDLPAVGDHAFMLLNDGTISRFYFVSGFLTLYYIEGKAGWTSPYYGDYSTAIWENPTTEPEPNTTLPTGSQQTLTTNESEFLTGYAAIIQSIIDKDSTTSYWPASAGILFDLNGDAIDELILLHHEKKDFYNTGEKIPCTVCSIYTKKDGAVVSLLKEKPLFSEAGGYSGNVYIGIKSGKAYILINGESQHPGEFDGEDFASDGHWYQYSYAGGNLSSESTISYRRGEGLTNNSYWEVLYQRSYAVIDGQRKGYDALENWFASFEIMEFMGTIPDHSGLPLGELLELANQQRVETRFAIYSDHTNLSIQRDSEITLGCAVLIDGEVSDNLSGITLQIEDGSILKTNSSKIENNRLYVKLQGITKGKTNVVFYDSVSGRKATVPISVTDKSYLWHTLDSVPEQHIEKYPTNFYNVNGLYIDSYNYSVENNGDAKVHFDVYNTNYSYAVVEVYNKDGILSDAAVIDKMTSSMTNFKEAVWDGTGFLIRDIIYGNAFTYRQESGFSKRTSIDVVIPTDGYIKIHTDPTQSLLTGFVNNVDLLMSMYSLAKDIEGFDTNSYKFAKKLTAKMLVDSAYTQILKDGDSAKNTLWKNVTWKTFITAESLGNFTDTIAKNIDELNLGEILFDTAKSFGYDVGETVAKHFMGPAGIALDVIFGIGKVENVLLQCSDLMAACGADVICIQNQGGGYRSCNQVVVTAQNAFSSDTALSVFTVGLEPELLERIQTQYPDVHEAVLSDRSYTYNISLLKGGVETQPDGKVTVCIPVPEKLRPLTAGPVNLLESFLKVYRIEENGTLTEMDIAFENGCIIFTTDHFSLYTIVGFESTTEVDEEPHSTENKNTEEKHDETQPTVEGKNLKDNSKNKTAILIAIGALSIIFFVCLSFFVLDKRRK